MMILGSVDHRRDELGKALYGIAIQLRCVPKSIVTIAASSTSDRRGDLSTEIKQCKQQRLAAMTKGTNVHRIPQIRVDGLKSSYKS
jgi:hypothetical protein